MHFDTYADRFAAAAETLVGTPFRLHGRNTTIGVDCVGLVVLALEQAGMRVPPLPAYALRNACYDFLPEVAARCGLVPAGGAPRRGDCLVTAPGPAQRHLHIALSSDTVIHAHAGLRRVVRMPWRTNTSVIHHWRFAPNLAQQEH